MPCLAIVVDVVGHQVRWAEFVQLVDPDFAQLAGQERDACRGSIFTSTRGRHHGSRMGRRYSCIVQVTNGRGVMVRGFAQRPGTLMPRATCESTTTRSRSPGALGRLAAAIRIASARARVTEQRPTRTRQPGNARCLPRVPYVPTGAVHLIAGGAAEEIARQHETAPRRGREGCRVHDRLAPLGPGFLSLAECLSWAPSCTFPCRAAHSLRETVSRTSCARIGARCLAWFSSRPPRVSARPPS